MCALDTSDDLSDLLSSQSSISFEHLNPHSGHESVLLRFDDPTTETTTNLLVDAGANVSLDTLEDDEYLSGVLLTHAHLDHYQSLPSVHRDAAPVYTSPGTAAVLDTVFESGHTNYDLNPDATADVLKHVEPLNHGWTSITNSLDIAPLPAGHTPGACGFLLQFTDGYGPHYVLVTGDFTPRAVAGYPEFDPPDALVDGDVHLDALFLTQATSDSADQQLTDALRITLERVRDGSPTLLTTNGLTGVHLGALLARAREQRLGTTTPPIVLAGQVAKLYADLGYDLPGIETVPVFDDPASVIDEAAAVVSGPEVPVEGGSKRFFDDIKTDSNATLVQLHTPATDPVESAGCTTYDLPYRAHPPQSVLDELVADLAPYEIVLVHNQDSEPDRYHDQTACFVWAPDYQDRHELYADGQWQAPEWISDSGVQRVQSRHPGPTDRERLSESALPELGCSEINLSREGIDVDALPETTSPKQSESEADTAEVTSSDDSSKLSDADSAPDTDPDGDAGPPSRKEIVDRLEGLEATVEDLPETQPSAETQETRSVSVRVVDAGDGLTLLRVDDTTLDVPHGTEIEIELPAQYLPADTDP
jgi:putative mRNA 3-end processing factor